MQIGAMNHPARNPLEEVEWFGQHGFDFVDFTLELPAADPDQIDPRAIRAALKRHGLGVVAHTAWFIPIGSPFGSVREASLAEFRRALRAAHQIGATVMNVHDRWDEYLDRLGSKLLHVHLSENDGTADQHLPLGAAPRSTTDWPQQVKKFKATGYDGTITLEVFAPQKEYLLLSRDLLRKWWAEA